MILHLQKGFTLSELTIAPALVSTIALGALTAGFQPKSRATSRMSLVEWR